MFLSLVYKTNACISFFKLMNFSFFLGSFYFRFLIVLCGSFILVSKRFHFLMSLLSLEIMILGLVLGVLSFSGVGAEGFLIFILLSFSSCEAALGLALLVRLVRSHGRDFIGLVGVLEC